MPCHWCDRQSAGIRAAGHCCTHRRHAIPWMGQTTNGAGITERNWVFAETLEMVSGDPNGLPVVSIESRS
jgi:hypothetical protein